MSVNVLVVVDVVGDGDGDVDQALRLDVLLSVGGAVSHSVSSYAMRRAACVSDRSVVPAMPWTWLSSTWSLTATATWT